MKKRKLTIFLFVFFVVIVGVLKVYFSMPKNNSDDVQTAQIDQFVQKYESVYGKYGDFKGSKIWYDRDRIVLKFADWLGTREEQYQGIVDTYNALIDTFYEENSEYENWTLVMEFGDSWGQSFEIYEFRGYRQGLMIISSLHVTSVKALAEDFSNATDIQIENPKYENINEIDGFENLESISFGNGFTDEEKKYVLSIFPNCVFR